MAGMTLKDREQLRRWLTGGASLEEVERTPMIGILDNERFTYAAVRAYKLLWTWGAARFSGSAGFAQDRFYRKRGYPALEHRFARYKAIAARLAAGK